MRKQTSTVNFDDEIMARERDFNLDLNHSILTPPRLVTLKCLCPKNGQKKFQDGFKSEKLYRRWLARGGGKTRNKRGYFRATIAPQALAMTQVSKTKRAGGPGYRSSGVMDDLTHGLSKFPCHSVELRSSALQGCQSTICFCWKQPISSEAHRVDWGFLFFYFHPNDSRTSVCVSG